ncbi:MAG: UbiA-like polyprenyltransferase, partial [bacterium]
MKRYFSFVRFEHTVFALPLILAGALLGQDGRPPIRVLLWIVVAAAGARTCAMALNRLIDASLDARNPRTVDRELPSGRMTPRAGWAVAAAGTAVYLGAAAALGRVCLQLAPVPLVVFAAYPYLKRFTPLAHLGVGIADALGPLGAWAAVRAAAGAPLLADAEPLWLLVGFTVLWIAGFDVIYATLDETFDRRAGLHSLPAWLGAANALRVSGLLHAAAGGALA